MILTSGYLLYRLASTNSSLVASIGIALLVLSNVLCFLKVEMNITRGRLLLSLIVHFGILATMGFWAGADWIGVGTGVLWYVCAWWLSLGRAGEEGKKN